LVTSRFEDRGCERAVDAQMKVWVQSQELPNHAGLLASANDENPAAVNPIHTESANSSSLIPCSVEIFARQIRKRFDFRSNFIFGIRFHAIARAYRQRHVECLPRAGAHT
jgi:hypothetical protein